MFEFNEWNLVFKGKGDISRYPCVVIQSTGAENWNNFTFNFEALVEILPGDGRAPLKISAYVMPVNQSGQKFPHRRLKDWINSNNFVIREFINNPSKSYKINNFVPFVTLLDSEDGYKSLTKWSKSFEERVSILRMLNDIVYLDDSNPVEAKNIIEQKEFALGVLRTSSAYRAFQRGWRYISSKNIEALDEARNDFNFSTKLHGFDNGTHELKIRFIDHEPFEDRIHCLIGINGVGKTRLLRELILTLSTKLENGYAEDPFNGNFLSEAISKNEYDGLSYNRLLVFSADDELRYPLTVKNIGSFEYQYFNLAKVNSGKKINGSFTLAGAMLDLLRDKETFGDGNDDFRGTRFQLLQKTMRNYIDLDKLYLQLNPPKNQVNWFEQDSDGISWVKALDLLRMNEQTRLEISALINVDVRLAFCIHDENNKFIREMHLSSGQTIFFRFALLLISSVDVGSLIIIDEPETHLHPNLICDFIFLLYEVLIATKSIALVATHSAYVVREVPTHCVHVLGFENESKQVTIGHVRLKTLGASIDSLSQAVFGDATVNKYHEKIAKEIADKKMSQEEILKKYKSILSSEMFIEIRSAMEQDEEDGGFDIA